MTPIAKISVTKKGSNTEELPDINEKNILMN